MERSIVCGVDDSDAGRSALGTADWLAARLDARLIALHTIDPDTGRDRRPRSIAGAAELAAAAEESALHVLEETVKEVEPIRKPELRVYYGDPSERLVSVAGEVDALLTVVGSSGYGALRSWLAGSVSGELIKSFDRPLVVVPPDAAVPGRGPAARALVCGVDASEGSNRAMALAAWLASSLSLRLVAAHAYAPAQSAATIPAASGVTVAHTKQLRDMAKRDAARVLERAEVVLGADVAVPRRLLVGEPAERLGEVAVRERAAMIVVGSRGRGPFASALLGSVSSALIAKAPVPAVIATDGMASAEAPGSPGS
jgi:nucleotide-binding universal stress UspA family protein